MNPGPFVLRTICSLEHFVPNYKKVVKLYSFFSAVPGLALPSWERIVLGTNVPDTNLPTLGIRLYSYAPYLQDDKNSL